MIDQQLLNTGILQLGLFIEKGQRVPYRLQLETLPAHPALFTAIMDAVIDNLPDSRIDRLVAHTDSVALAGAIAQKTGISLVYSRNGIVSPAHDLVGAYDVGHPACLLVNTLPDNVHKLIFGCQQVGLDIQVIVALVATKEQTLSVPIISIYSLENIITGLHNQHEITSQQKDVVLKYVRQRTIAQSSD